MMLYIINIMLIIFIFNLQNLSKFTNYFFQSFSVL